MMATPGTHISGASSGQLRTSQLDPNAAAPTLFDADGPRILYATLSNLKVVLKLLEALQFKDVRALVEHRAAALGSSLTEHPRRPVDRTRSASRS